MARSDGDLRQISVQGGGVTITLGRTQATVPADRIDAIIKALEAAKLMLGLEAASGEAEAEEPAVAPAEAAPAPTRGGRRRAAEAAPAKQRSRKRVGDALAEWLRQNPGWHSTETLLEVVSEERMTDASPKRALMIALGKQRDSIFTSDGHGHWKLAEDPSPAPAPEPRVRKKPGRKPGSGKKVAAKAAKPAKASGRGKRQTGGRRGRPSKSAAADQEGSSAPEMMSEAPDLFDLPEPTSITPAKVVRVKRGQARKEVLLTPQELEARRQAATAADALMFRWDSSSRAERERIRRNLFGDEPNKLN